jgi:hypothetical protein
MLHIVLLCVLTCHRLDLAEVKLLGAWPDDPAAEAQPAADWLALFTVPGAKHGMDGMD